MWVRSFTHLAAWEFVTAHIPTSLEFIVALSSLSSLFWRVYKLPGSNDKKVH